MTSEQGASNNLSCSLCDKFVKILRPQSQDDIDDDTEVKCDDCGNDEPVVALCINCTQYLCEPCNSYHMRKRHNIVPVEPIEKVLYCPIHNKKELDHYCETCDKVVCHYCVTKDHVGHTLDTVESTASKHRNELTNIIAPVDEMTSSLTTTKREIGIMKGKIDDQAGEIERMIDKCLADQVARLNEHHHLLKKQLLGELSRKEEALTMQMEDIQSVQDQLANMKKQRDGLQKTPSRKVLSKKKEDVKKCMQEVSNRYQTLHALPVETDSIDFVPVNNPDQLLGHLFTSAHPLASEVIDLPHIVGYNTKVDVAIQTRNCKGGKCTEGGHHILAELKSAAGNVTVGEVIDNNDGSYVVSFVASEVGDVELSVSIYGQHIRGSPYSIVVGRNYQGVDMPDEIVNDNGSMKGPWGIAFGNNGKWVMVDHSNNSVCIFNGENEVVKRFGSSGSYSGQFSSPRGVAFDSDNHFYVIDSGNNRVQKFSIKGNYLLQFGNDGDAKLNSPHGITIHNHEAYVTDFHNHRIAVFQTNGQFCTHFGSEHLKGPIDVAVNTYNHLLVLDHHNHCVVTFTLDGYHVGKFGTQGSGWGELHYPYGLVLDANGCILIADQSNNRVAVFDKFGIYIDSFGSKGANPGQFNIPRGVALSPNGSIYVSDGANKRVQIFSNC